MKPSTKTSSDRLSRWALSIRLWFRNTRHSTKIKQVIFMSAPLPSIPHKSNFGKPISNTKWVWVSLQEVPMKHKMEVQTKLLKAPLLLWKHKRSSCLIGLMRLLANISNQSISGLFGLTIRPVCIIWALSILFAIKLCRHLCKNMRKFLESKFYFFKPFCWFIFLQVHGSARILLPGHLGRLCQQRVRSGSNGAKEPLRRVQTIK